MSEHSHFFNKIFRWQLYATVYISLIQLVTIILLGRYLPYKELGSFALFQIVFRFALYSLDPGMFFSIIQKHEYNWELIKLLLRKQLLYIIFSALGLVFIMLFTTTFNEIHPIITANCFVIILLIGIGSYAQSKLVVDFRQKEIVIAQMIAYSAELIFLVILCNYYNPMIIFTFGVVLRFVLFYGICFLFQLQQQKIEQTYQVLKEDVKSHFTQSKFNIWSQILSFVQGQYDTVIIIVLFGLPVLGGYILVTEISYMIFAKINPLFNKAIIPVVSKSFLNKSNTSTIISESLISYSYLIFILYLLFWNFRSELFQFAYPEKYQDLVYYASFLIPIALCKAMNNILVSYLVALSESRKIFYWNIIILIINYTIILCFYLFKGSLNNFLIMGLGYGILSLLTIYFLMNQILEDKNIQLSLSINKWFILILIMFMLVYIIKIWVGYFFISMILSIICILILLYIFEKERVTKWCKLSIV
ncbi:MAG: oligosaccharide flippase family protein [Saprospiraceae bacterium]